MKREIYTTAGNRRKFVTAFLGVFLITAAAFGDLGHAVEMASFAGGEIDGRGQGFSYIGADLTQRLNKNVAVSGRIVPNYLTYKYYSGNNLIRAKSPGLAAVAGLKLSLDQTTLGLFGGMEFRDTTLSPDDQTAKVRGNTTAGLVQGEFDTWFPTRTNLNVMASYSGTDDFFYERGRVKQQVCNLDFRKPNNISVGLEQFYGRNADYDQAGGGLLLEVYNIPMKFALILRGGYKHDSTFGNGSYGGLELYKAF